MSCFLTGSKSIRGEETGRLPFFGIEIQLPRGENRPAMAASRFLLLPPNPLAPAFASPLPIRSPASPKIRLAVSSDRYRLHVPTQITSSRVLHPGHIFSISSPSRSICCGADCNFNSFQHSVGSSVQTCRAQSSSTFVSNKETRLRVPVLIGDSLAANAELQVLADQIQLDGPMVLKLALDNLKDTKWAEAIELSVMICSDYYIQGLNREWRGEDTPTDVLSFPQEQPPGVSSTILLGDVIISFDTAKRQAEEREHSLLDEMRILLLHGLLHVLGYDHEEGLEAAKEMEHEESRILRILGWKGSGLISAAFNDSANDNGGMGVYSVAKVSDMTEEGIKAKKTKRPPFRVLFCDMDGTLLNSRSKVTEKTACALKEAIAHGVKVMIATGKSRPAAMSALQQVGLVGENGAISVFSPGVFLQAEILPSVEYLVKNIKIQKLVFIDTVDGVKKILRPHWLIATKGRARLVQAMDDMLEVLPDGASKGRGVKLLLDHLRINPDDVMAIGDGENDIEMLELAGLGVAMGNGSAQTLAIADAQVSTNDEDGVAEAIERFILT